MSTPFTLSFPMEHGRYLALRERLAQTEVELPDGDKGKIEWHGCRLWFEYNGDTLELTVTDKPFLITTDFVTRKIKEFVDQV